MRLAAVLAVTALLLSACGGSDEQEPERLPDVSLASFDGGDPLELGELKGPAVVNLWASWCVPCKRELPIYARFAREHAARVKVIGVDFQETDRDAARDLLRRSGVSYPVVSDPDGKLRAIGLPEIVLLDAEGRVVHREYVEITSLDQLERLVEKHLEVAL